jgi:hypothetical protein
LLKDNWVEFHVATWIKKLIILAKENNLL